MMICIMLVSLTFQIAMLPSIRVWYEADGDYSIFDVAEEDESNRIGDVTVDPDIEPEVISFDWDAFDF